MSDLSHVAVTLGGDVLETLLSLADFAAQDPETDDADRIVIETARNGLNEAIESARPHGYKPDTMRVCKCYACKEWDFNNPTPDGSDDDVSEATELRYETEGMIQIRALYTELDKDGDADVDAFKRVMKVLEAKGFELIRQPR